MGGVYACHFTGLLFSHIHLPCHDWQVVSCQSAQMRRAICLNHTASKAPAPHVTQRGRSSDNAFHRERAAVNLCISFTLCSIRPYWSVSIIEECSCKLMGVCFADPGCKHDTSHGVRNHVWVTLCMWCNTSKKMSPKRAHKQQIGQRIIFCYDYLEVVFPWKAKSVFDMLFQILTALSFQMSVLVSCSIFVRALNLPKT